MRIVGICGKKGCGKSFVADLAREVFRENTVTRSYDVPGRSVPRVVDYLPEVESLAFADPIKEFAINILGIDAELIYGNDRDKNTPTKYRWEKMPSWLSTQFATHGMGVPTGAMTIRHIMQVFGTQLNRDIWSRTIWTDAMKRRIDKCHADVVLIADTRYQNEIDAIHSWGGKVWKIDGPQRGDAYAMNDAHESEKVIDCTVGHDHVIMNTLEDNQFTLKDRIRKILEIS